MKGPYTLKYLTTFVGLSTITPVETRHVVTSDAGTTSRLLRRSNCSVIVDFVDFPQLHDHLTQKNKDLLQKVCVCGIQPIKTSLTPSKFKF